MPPVVASLLTWGLILWLFRRDFRERPNVTSGLWVPTLWIWLITTRSFTEWIHTLFGVNLGAKSLEAGSPLDAAIYFCLLLAAFTVLQRRRVRLAEVIRGNGWLALFLAYGLLSIVWSDYPFVSLKRWIKVLGHPMMALILFTEPDPVESLRRLMKRCAYIFLPVSILFIKYYPHYGRGFDGWTGVPHNTGITDDKNALGWVLMILTCFFVWHFLQTLARRDEGRKGEIWLCLLLLGMIGWLFPRANSKTALVSSLVGIALMLMARIRWIPKERLGSIVLVLVVAGVGAEFAFGATGLLLNLLGRDATLTGRTELWQSVLNVEINPMLGAGFESFWLGERLTALWEQHAFRPNQAHNGYLETYVNLGLVGLFILLGMILSAFGRARRALMSEDPFGQFRLCMLAAVVFFNWTESSFKTLHAVWFAFYLIALEYQHVAASAEEAVADNSLDDLGSPAPA